MAATAMRFDDREFKFAMQQYLARTSKHSVDAVNGKMKDLMYMSAKYTPMMQGVSMRARNIRNPYAVAAWRQRNRGGKQDFDESGVYRELRRLKRPSKGYMKSAFVKAGRKFRKTDASTAPTPTISSAKFPKARVVVALATLQKVSAISQTIWGALASDDEKKKQAIVDESIDRGLRAVYYDIQTYLNKKFAQEAKAISR